MKKNKESEIEKKDKKSSLKKAGISKDKQKNFKESYERALADYQNLLKRTAKERREFAKYANENLICDIIPVYDNLKIAIAHSDKENHDSWLNGVKYVVKQFKDLLKNFGVEEIKTSGQVFDPATMEALEGSGEKVKQELRSGYILSGKVIIAAKVVLEDDDKNIKNKK